MVTLGSKRIHMIYSDSRGLDLDHRMARLNTTGECFDITSYKGAVLQDLFSSAENYLPKHPFDVVYIAGGACDITAKDQTSNMITFDWDPFGDDLMEHLVSSLTKADAGFKSSFPASKVVYFPLVGTDLARVVSSQEISPEDQEAVDRAVWEFNSMTFQLNAINNTFAPSLHHLVHRFCKGKKRAYYQHLADGLHPSEVLKDKWAKEFIKAMAHN